jgi:hypothetical protein
MTARLPYGANAIVALRHAGKRPADLVLVSLIGPLNEVNPVVVAHPGRDYDWRFLVGLQVLVVAHSEQLAQDVRRVLNCLKALPARSLTLWLADVQDGRHWIVDGVVARRNGVLHYLNTTERATYAGLGANATRERTSA